MEFNSGFKGLSCFYIGYVFYFVVGCIMCDVLLKYAFLCTNILLGIKNALYSLFIYLFVCFLCYHEYHTICMFIASQMYPGVLFMGLLCCKRHREKASLYTKSESYMTLPLASYMRSLTCTKTLQAMIG